MVLAPNALYRAGRAPVLPMPDFTDPDNRAAFMQSIRPVIEQLTPEADMGARVGWRIAAAYPDRVKALGGFHGGGLVTDALESPHRSAERLKAEVYFGHALLDRGLGSD